MDIKIFVDTPDDIRLLRRVRRDIIERGRELDQVLRQYEDRVRPMHLSFVEPAKRFADIIVPKGGENAIAIDIITTKINELLRLIPESDSESDDVNSAARRSMSRATLLKSRENVRGDRRER